MRQTEAPQTETRRRGGFWTVLGLMLLSVTAACCFSLGMWQLGRAEERDALHHAIEQGRRQAPLMLGTHTPAWVLATLIFGSISAVYWWTVWADVTLPSLSFGLASLPDQLAGVANGMFYACLLVLLMRIGPSRALAAVLAPMGRMALTNYLMATVLFLIFAPILGIENLADWPQITGLVVGIIVIEAIWSRLWLTRFRYGPAEWAWRCVTWWRTMPITK